MDPVRLTDRPKVIESVVRARVALACAGIWAFLFAIVVVAFWPGVPVYDTVYQYREVISGQVTDWHPPVMVQLWRVFATVHGGTGSMFLLQAALFGGGFALLIGSLVHQGRATSAFAVAAIGLFPLFVGWQMVVIKDQQMLGAMVGAAGVASLFPHGQQMPLWSRTAITALLLYATLLRTNAAFATVPLAILLLVPSTSPRRLAWMCLALIPAAIVTTGLLNVHLLDATATDRPKSQALFDAAGIAVRTTDPRPFTATERAVIASRNCANPFFWDPLEIDPQCTTAATRVRNLPSQILYGELVKAIVRDPLAYAQHRLAHWNMSQRLWTPPGLIGAKPPLYEQPNELGLRGPRSIVSAKWQISAAISSGLFIGWPIFWTTLALLLFPVAIARRSDEHGNFVIALLVSALSLETSFLFISIASELRYHLWPMAATAIALTLLISEKTKLRFVNVLILLAICSVGTIARDILPQAPANYESTLTVVW